RMGPIGPMGLISVLPHRRYRTFAAERLYRTAQGFSPWVTRRASDLKVSAEVLFRLFARYSTTALKIGRRFQGTFTNRLTQG
ncbi:MAG TPA: hypothetical protein VE641_11220, partial [Chthoniobacterales bacterium]|nr:hypothetical protein [Chthoniobacterales bacterium]